jgi:hypothetical protein
MVVTVRRKRRNFDIRGRLPTAFAAACGGGRLLDLDASTSGADGSAFGVVVGEETDMQEVDGGCDDAACLSRLF